MYLNGNSHSYVHLGNDIRIDRNDEIYHFNLLIPESSNMELNGDVFHFSMLLQSFDDNEI